MKKYQTKYLVPHLEGQTDEITPLDSAILAEEGKQNLDDYQEASRKFLNSTKAMMQILLLSKINQDSRAQVYALCYVLGFHELIDGKSQKEIAVSCGIQPPTLHRMITNYREKLTEAFRRDV